MRLRTRLVGHLWVCDVIDPRTGRVVYTTEECPMWTRAEDAAARWVGEVD